jgi:alkylation response protein AidB-like acyl-CoA dehydrogenase
MDFRLTEEQRALIDLARGLATRHAPSPHVSWTEAGEFPWAFATDLALHGLTGIDISEERGGQGLTLLDSILVLEAVGTVAPHLADAVQATNFGAIREMAAFASPRLQEEVVRPALEGRSLATIAMSEPGAGSAASHMRTRAEKSDGSVRVNGQKVFNSNGPHATHFVVWARFGVDGDQVGALVVPDVAPGFSRGKAERFNSGEMHCTLNFDDAQVPLEYVLLDSDGFRKMMPIFNIERLGNATRSLALGELAFQLATDHVVERETGGHRLASHQGLRWKLADIRMRLDAARLLVYRAATELRDGVPDPLYTSIAKCYANEAGFFAANESLQLFGGYGFTPEFPLSYLLNRTRGWMIAGGSVEVLRNRIAVEILERRPTQ